MQVSIGVVVRVRVPVRRKKKNRKMAKESVSGVPGQETYAVMRVKVRAMTANR